MVTRVRRRQTWYAVTAQEPGQASTGHGERGLATRLGVAVAMIATAELVAVVLVPGLRSLVGLFLAYSLALIGALLVESLRERSRRFSSVTPARVTQTPSVDATPEAEQARIESRRAA